MKHVVIGTAGHVDHGKTMLVKALTGQDTDRLKEEKERGISIELGFAPLKLSNGQLASIIDVPGHEKFIKQMLAGVGGIDLVLFVIAADEGVMPQTKEHLDIIKLLQIQQGIVVITKADLVDEDWLELIQEEIKDVLVDTPLKEAPIVAVSSTTKEGISQLLAQIEKILSSLQESEVRGKGRMSIDRIFSITGFGTVVTGTLTSGKFMIGDLLEILPEGLQVKVRSLQVHGQKVEEAQEGQRVAVNLSGIEVNQIQRGSVLTECNSLKPNYRLDCQLELLKDASKEIINRARVRIHIGTKEILGRVLLLDRDQLKPGEQAFVQLLLEEPAVTGKKDKFVIRSYSPMVTIGGGLVIDPNPEKHKRFSERVLSGLATKLKGTPEELIEQFLGHSKGLTMLKELQKELGLTIDEIEEGLGNLIDSKVVKRIPFEGIDAYVLVENYQKWINQIKSNLTSYHSKFPLRIGFNKEELRSKLFGFLSNKQYNFLLQALFSDGLIKVTEDAVSMANFEPTPTAQEKKILDEIEQEYLRKSFQPPSWEETREVNNLNQNQSDEFQLFLIEKGLLVRIEDLLFHQKIVSQGMKLIENYLLENREITLGEARDIFNTSRKYMLPLLEYFDRIRFTRRVEDKRVLFRVK